MPVTEVEANVPEIATVAVSTKLWKSLLADESGRVVLRVNVPDTLLLAPLLYILLDGL